MQEIKYTPVDKLSPHPQNPRLIKDEQFKVLCDSIKANPDYFETRPILANKDGVIFAGNMRYLAAKEIGMKEVPAVIMDIPEERQREIMIRDNISNGKYDWDILANNFNMDELLGWGFDKQELQRGFDTVIKPEPKDDEVPELGSQPIRTQGGDVWLLGRHRLVCGDSTLPADVAVLLNGQKADMVWTDPPYGVNYSGQGKEWDVLENDQLQGDAFYGFISKAIANVRAAIKDTAGVYIFHASTTAHQFKKAIEESGMEISNQLIWNKPGAGAGWGDYRWKHEPFYYCHVKGTQPAFYGDRTNWTVIDFTKDEKELMDWVKRQKQSESQGKGTIWTLKRDATSKYLHPTQKPVELAVIGISNSSRAGDIVLDLFAGSGSTLIASEKTDRTCFAMEYDPKYCDVILERFYQFANQDPVRESDGKKWSELKSNL